MLSSASANARGLPGYPFRSSSKVAGLGIGMPLYRSRSRRGPEKGRVRGLEPEDQAKRLLAFLFQPPDGPVHHHIFHIALVNRGWAGLAVRAFGDHRPEIIGRGARIAEVIVEVPFVEVADVRFAEQPHFIPGLPQKIREQRNVRGNRAVLIVHAAGVVRVQAGQGSGPRGKAQGVGHEGIPELNPLPPDAVEIGSLENAVAVEAEGVRSMAVRGHENQVGPLRRPRAAERPADPMPGLRCP